MGKVPKKAKKVFEGKIFDIYQWEQELFDGTTATYEMAKRSNTLDVIPTVGDKILLINEEQPTKKEFMSLIGGKQDDGETPLEGIKREFLEEVGMASDDWEHFATHDVTHKLEWDVHTFIARDCKKVADPTPEGGEKISPVLVDFDKFIDVITSGDNRWWKSTLATAIMDMRLEPKKLEEFKKKLFPKMS